MKKYTDLEFLRLSQGQKFLYKFLSFFAGIPGAIGRFFLGIGKAVGGFFAAIGRELADVFVTFKDGDWKTKTSYLIMGFGSIARGQVLRGLLFLLFEVVFIFYMVTTGGYWLSMLPSLGKIGPHEEYDMILDAYTTAYGDKPSISLYSRLTSSFVIIICFVKLRP